MLTIGLLYTAANSNPSGRPAYGEVRVGARQLPYLPLAAADGTPLPVAKDYRQGYIDTAGGGKLLNWKYYPLEDFHYGKSLSATRSMMAKLGAQYTLLKGLAADIKYQYENQQVNLESIQGLQSYSTRNMVNLYTQLNYSTGSVKYMVPMGDILRLSSGHLQSHSVRGQLAYNCSFGNHAVAALAGAELRHTNNLGSNATVYGYNHDVLTTGRVDFANTFPTFVNGNTAAIPDGVSFSDKLTRFASGFANIAWTVYDRYTISASGRKDASNLFGVATNEKGVPLWSVGGAWHISKENFYNINTLPYLKLRATYGFQGNIDPGRSAVTTVAYTSSASYTNFQQVSVNQFANPLLRWEKVAMFNAGLDFAFAKESVSGSIELYRKKATDLFGSAPIDYTAGLGNAAVTRNVAEMKGRGVEAILNTRAKISVINWTGTVLFNYSKSTTTKFYRPVSLARILLSNGNSISALEGGSLYSVISYKWGGLNSSGAPQGYLNDTLSTDYNAITGTGTPLNGLVYKNALPAYFGSFTNSFQYKGLSLTANFTYKLGYWFRKSSFTYAGLFSTGAGHSDYAKRWQKPGDELITNIPALVYPSVANREAFYINSEATTANAGHVRLQFVSLAYELNKTQWKALPLRSVQLYFNAANLGILWRANKEGLDPEFADIPPVKTFSVGLRTAL